MTARLPTSGGDDGTWGDILNAYLLISHASDGTLNSNVVGTAQLQNNSVTNAQLDVSTQTIVASVASKYVKPGGGIPSTDLSGAAQTNLAAASTAVQSVNGKTGTSVSLAASDVSAAQSLVPTSAKTSAYNAVSGDFIPVDASGGAVTITLPTTPADKTRIGVKLINVAGLNTAIIAAGGSDVFNKAGGSASLSLSLLNQGMLLQYASSTGIWYVQADDLALTQLDSHSASLLAGVPITNPNGLRRWRAALADGLNAEAPIVCVGDSHTFGQNANGSMTANPSDNAADSQLNYVGQLRQLLSRTYGDPGEGFILSNPARDNRVVAVGGGTFSSPGQAVSIIHNNYRLTANSQNLTIAIPTGNGITRLGVIQSNNSGDAAVTWSQNGNSMGNVSAVSGSGVPFNTYLAVNPGDSIVITGPASGQNTILGFSFRTTQTAGVVVHRIGAGGYTQGFMLGGDYNGQLGTLDGSSFFTTGQQQANVSAHYTWAGAKGLVLIMYGTNEQTNQLGSAGLHNGITPTIFQSGLQTTVNQIVADGWCALLVSPCPSGSENHTVGAAPLTSYATAMKTVAAITDHVACIDIGDLWGTGSTAVTAASAAGLRDAGSSHPTRSGYGDEARNIYKVINATTPLGN